MQNVLIWASNVLIFSSYASYEWAMIKGRAKPHRTTRFVLFIIITLGFFSVLAQNNNPALTWFLGICAVQSLVMLFMSLKYGMGGWAKIDIACLLVALAGIVLWRVTANPVLALYAAVTADLVGMIPALIKTYRLPDTEYWLTYIFDLAAILLTGLAIQNGGFNEYLYPAYLFIINAVILFFILRPRLLVSKTNKI